MTPELDAALVSRHPKIFPPYSTDGRFGFECLDGWAELLDAAAGLVQQFVDATGVEQVFARQVKEKFGSLRIYLWNADERAVAIFDLIEGLSASICEECGQPGSIQKRNGWLLCRCPEHTMSEAVQANHAARIELSTSTLMELLDVALKRFDYSFQPCLRWFTQPAIVLGSIPPINIVHSDEGRKQILNVLKQIEFGASP